MSHYDWMLEFTGDSLRGIARRINVGASNLSKQARTYLPADRVIEIANAYGKDPIKALQETGHLDAGESQAKPESAVKKETLNTRRGLLVSLGWLGNMALNDVKTSDILKWRKELESGRSWIPAPEPGKVDKRALSHSTAGGVTGQLMSVLKLAHEDGILRKMPVVKVSKTALPKRLLKADIVTIEEVDRLIRCARTQKGHYKAKPWLSEMITVAAGTGMRISEICGLKVSDVDFNAKELHVSRQVMPLAVEAPPKSRTSERAIPLPDWMCSFLWKLAANGKSPDDYFWLRGDRPHDRNSTTHALRSCVDSWGLRPCTFHDFRHFYASQLIANGASVAAVSKVLGHADAATTLGFYVHLWPGDDNIIRAAVAPVGV